MAHGNVPGQQQYCHACGSPLPADATFCPQCSRRLTGEGGSQWRGYGVYGVAAGAVLFLVAFVLIAAIRRPTESQEAFLGLVFLAGWVLLPVSTYFDLRYVWRNTGWRANAPLWAMLSMVPFLNALSGLAYVYNRLTRTRSDQ